MELDFRIKSLFCFVMFMIHIWQYQVKNPTLMFVLDLSFIRVCGCHISIDLVHLFVL